MIAFTGGGTGGHLSIIRAVAKECQNKIPCIYIGSLKGQDRAWFENSELFEKTYFLPSSGVVDKKGLSKLTSLANILKQSLKCKEIFAAHQIKKVFCVGGYSAAPASIGAIISKKELFIHEQNAITGNLNAMLKFFANDFFSSYENAKTFTSYPVKESFFKLARKREKLENILFLGGSQGARAINKLAMQIAPNLHALGIKIIHQTGEKEFKIVQDFYMQNGIQADCFAFDKTIENKMQKADFAISRAGASSLWELSANGLPSLFIPFAYAAKDHQYHNAKQLMQKKACLLLREEEANMEAIMQILSQIKLADMSERLEKLINPNGAKEILDKILA